MAEDAATDSPDNVSTTGSAAFQAAPGKPLRSPRDRRAIPEHGQQSLPPSPEDAGSVDFRKLTGSPEGDFRSRGYLPHFDQPGLVQMITFRLADALPREAVIKLGQIEQRKPDLYRRAESWLDAGYGACVLGTPEAAQVVSDALRHFDQQRYVLFAWVIMPNHVHVLIETRVGWSISAVVHSWKSFTANTVNRQLGRTGPLWQREYFDRAIRDERHFWAVVDYIHNNPVKANLVSEAKDWPFSSFSE